MPSADAFPQLLYILRDSKTAMHNNALDNMAGASGVVGCILDVFYNPRQGMRSKNGGTPAFEFESRQKDQDFLSNWGGNPVQNDFGNDRTVWQQIEGFEDGSQRSYFPIEGSLSFPWPEHELMIADANLNAPRIETDSEIAHPASTSRAIEDIQRANCRTESGSDNHDLGQRPLHLEARLWESLQCDVGQDLHVTSIRSSASAGCTNVCTAQKDDVFTAEKYIECPISDRNAPTPEDSKTQERQFPCDVEGCNLAFTRAYELGRHKDAVHGEGQQFPCPKQGCKFSMDGPIGRKDKLRDHINNVHPDIDLTSVPELQQPLRPALRSSAGKQMKENKPNSRLSTTTQSRKRRRISPTGSSSEVQEFSDTEVKRLRKVVEELKEDNRQREERHERELEDLKDQYRWLRKLIDDVMKRPRE